MSCQQMLPEPSFWTNGTVCIRAGLCSLIRGNCTDLMITPHTAVCVCETVSLTVEQIVQASYLLLNDVKAPAFPWIWRDRVQPKPHSQFYWVWTNTAPKEKIHINSDSDSVFDRMLNTAKHLYIGMNKKWPNITIISDLNSCSNLPCGLNTILAVIGSEWPDFRLP